MNLVLDRTLDAPYGEAVGLSPLVTRLLAPNPSVFTFKGTGVYIVGAGPGVAVIDPGPTLPDHIEALKRALDGRRVSHILITHTHNDHSPAAAALKAWSGARTYAAAPAPRDIAASPPPLRAGEVPVASLAMRRAEGEEKTAVDEAHDHGFVPDVTVRDGDIIAGGDFTLECVATPGHTAGHMCYALLQEQALFTGDHVMGWSTSVIAPPDGDMGAYMASLEKLIARQDRVLYPTHGSPIAAPDQYLPDLLAHRRMREAQIAAALRRGADTLEALTAQLYPDIAPALRAAAATQILAHLAVLEKQGRVTRDGVRYRLSP